MGLCPNTIDELRTTAVELLHKLDDTCDLSVVRVEVVVIDVELDIGVCSSGCFEGDSEDVVAENLCKVGRFDATVLVL